MMLFDDHHGMRTTLTLDEDVAAKLQEAMNEAGVSFKEIVNRMLRRGLMGVPETAPRERFQVHARPLKARPGVSYDNIGELLQSLDEPYPL